MSFPRTKVTLIRNLYSQLQNINSSDVKNVTLTISVFHIKMKHPPSLHYSVKTLHFALRVVTYLQSCLPGCHTEQTALTF